MDDRFGGGWVKFRREYGVELENNGINRFGGQRSDEMYVIGVGIVRRRDGNTAKSGAMYFGVVAVLTEGRRNGELGGNGQRRDVTGRGRLIESGEFFEGREEFVIGEKKLCHCRGVPSPPGISSRNEFGVCRRHGRGATRSVCALEECIEGCGFIVL